MPGNDQIQKILNKKALKQIVLDMHTHTHKNDNHIHNFIFNLN